MDSFLFLFRVCLITQTDSCTVDITGKQATLTFGSPYPCTHNTYCKLAHKKTSHYVNIHQNTHPLANAQRPPSHSPAHTHVPVLHSGRSDSRRQETWSDWNQMNGQTKAPQHNTINSILSPHHFLYFPTLGSLSHLTSQGLYCRSKQCG